MCTVAVVAALAVVASAAGSRVEDEADVEPRFNNYDELAYNEYESDGEEWGNYNAIPDLYNEEQRLVSVQRNSNRRKKTGQSNVQEMANNPFDDPFFNQFIKKHKKKQEQATTVQQPAKIQATRPPTPATTSAPVKKQAVKVSQPPQQFEKKAEQNGKPLKTNGEKQKQNEMIREFTLMISKLLFQLSQMKE